MIGDLHLQQCPYLCLILLLLYIRPFSSRILMTSSATVLTFLPAMRGNSSVYLPFSATGQNGAMPYLLPVS